MRNSGTRALFSYWNRVRGERSAPARAQIAPEAIASLLPSTFILDANDAAAPFRLAGTRLCTLFGTELTGRPFAQLFRRDDRLLAGRVLAAVTQTHAIAVIDLDGEAEGGRTISLEAIILPLADDPARVLGAVNPCTLPYWLGAYPLDPARITSVRVMDPDRELFSLSNRPAIPIRSHRTQSGPSRRVLRVIEGNAAMAARLRHETWGDRPPLRLLDGGRSRDE